MTSARSLAPVQWARLAWYRTLELSPRAWHRYQLRRFGGRRQLVHAGIDLCIEGYPGSANSFVVENLWAANPGLAVASHVHRMVHVRAALDLGVPVVVLLRPPVDAITSIIVRAAEGSVPIELRRYERFYRQLLPLAPRVGLVRFEDATTCLGEALAAQSSYLGVPLPAVDDHDDAVRERVQARIDLVSRRVFGAETDLRQAAPSERRQEAKAGLATQFERPGAARRLARCERLHAEVSAMAQFRLERWRRGEAARS